jgi:hypothetical protein
MRQPLPVKYEEDLKVFFQGLKRIVAENKQQDEVSRRGGRAACGPL